MHRLLAALGLRVAVLVPVALLACLTCAPTRRTDPDAIPGDLPHLPTKPAVVGSTFKGCGPDGKGGDVDLNRLKNRADVPVRYYPVAFHAILDLPWPRAVERRARSTWRLSAKAAVERWEGIPVQVEGWLVKAKLEGKEACNCESAEEAMHDIHVWLVAEYQDDEDRQEAIVVEIAPRHRAKHPAWTPTRIVGLGKAKTHVRIGGWLLLDQEHEEQLEKTRGTLWEVHPVTEIEVDQDGKWVKLDDL